jgi:Cu-processing system permease protein
MYRVGRALVVHEFQERIRDRWVMVVTVLFASMALAVTLYGRSVEEQGALLTGPSLVTLAALLVPLVALVLGHDTICGERERNTLGLLLSMPVSRSELLVSKYLGRLLAMTLSVSLGLGLSLLVTDESSRYALLWLIGPTLLLGASFLALGTLLSVLSSRQATSISLAVAAWFLLVFFYDMGLLGLLVMTDGALSTDAVSKLVAANPAGLFRMGMMQEFGAWAGSDKVGHVSMPSTALTTMIWGLWIAGPLVVSSLVLSRRKTHR